MLSSHEFSSFAKSLKTADLSGLKIADGKLDGTVGFKSEFKGGHGVSPGNHAVVKSGADAGGGFKHHIDIDADLLKREINLPSGQVQAKFKHAKHFGLSGNYNKENARLFEQKLAEHIKSPDTVVVAGTYRGKQNVVHYYNPKTNLNVMKDMDGNFISGWELAKGQQTGLTTIGNVDD
jgi:hypothetical protein